MSSQDRRPAAIRYESKVDRSDAQGCHPWTGFRNGGGYGRFSVGGRATLAHCFGYELRFGPIPPGMKVCHSCDNPPCQNADHWFLGSQADNVADRQAKGRGRAAPGAANSHAKLSPQQVEEIRRSYTGKHGEQVALARRFGVKKAQISKILAGTSWQ